MSANKTIKTVIFIDDEKHIRHANQQTLELSGFEVIALASAEKALPLLSDNWPGIIICDIKMPGMSGIDFLREVRKIDIELPVTLISGHADIATAVEGIQQGAYDFIEKPFPAERLIETVKRSLEKRTLTLENRALKKELESQEQPGPRIIGRAPAIKQLRAEIRQLADTQADVLIIGETGTGKELVARSLHEHSQRRTHNFVALNCGAVPDNLLESEFFGHEAGSFTGATGKRIGKFEHSDGGTFFLDEVESMDLSTQVHLLRVLQERHIERLGSNEIIPLNLRVIAASKIDLKKAADDKAFREDLYYRLNVVTLNIPPLRHRKEDIPLLFQHFMLLADARYERESPHPKPENMASLLKHSWPGNVRELRNAAERYVLTGQSCQYNLDKLLNTPADDPLTPTTLSEQVNQFEKSIIEQSLINHNGSIKDVMEILAIPRKTLYDKMQKYALDKHRYKNPIE